MTDGVGALPPFYLYFTRPEAFEVYMGGMRSVAVWMREPSYSHDPVTENVFGDEIWAKDHGWYDRADRARARGLLKQDEDLLRRVWGLIIWSVAPIGTTLDDAVAWADARDGANWEFLHDDKKWEARCNRCHKRLVIRADVRTNHVNLFVPQVCLRGRHSSTPILRTTEISDALAIEGRHAPSPDHLPF